MAPPSFRSILFRFYNAELDSIHKKTLSPVVGGRSVWFFCSFCRFFWWVCSAPPPPPYRKSRDCVNPRGYLERFRLFAPHSENIFPFHFTTGLRRPPLVPLFMQYVLVTGKDSSPSLPFPIAKNSNIFHACRIPPPPPFVPNYGSQTFPSEDGTQLLRPFAACASSQIPGSGQVSLPYTWSRVAFRPPSTGNFPLLGLFSHHNLFKTAFFQRLLVPRVRP